MVDPKRLWSRIDRRGPDECWPWTGRIDRQGYGRLTCWIRGRKWKVPLLAHRLVFEVVNGYLPEWPLRVLHAQHCTTRACCNPAHLREGTAHENNQDMVALGRECTKARSLTPDQVREIRSLVAGGASKADVARQFNRDFMVITHIVRGRTYRKVA